MLAALLATSPAPAEHVTPEAQKEIVVSPPAREAIAVPEKYQGLRESKDKFGKPYTEDFTAAYRGGFLAGWEDFLEQFQSRYFDLDEATDPARFPEYFGWFVQTHGRSSFHPGYAAGMTACRDEILALVKQCNLTFLPVRTPWEKRIQMLGGGTELNAAGNPTRLCWPYTTANMKIGDDDLKVLQEVSMADVEWMGISWTAITDTGVARLPPMPRLTHLEITGNNLTGACFLSLDKFPRLASLTIVGPQTATAGDLAAVKKLSELETLDLCAIEIGDDAIPVILALPKLSNLRLNWAYDLSRGAKLTPEAIAKLSGCNRLKLLDLSGCAVDDRALRALAGGLPGLWSLSLARTQVTDESIGSLQKLPKLEWLRLSHSRVTDAGIAALAFHPSVKTLLLNDTQVSDQALVTLETLPNLKEINVRQSQFSKAAIAAFKERKPGVTVSEF